MRNPRPNSRRRVVLCLPLAYAYARGVARGVAAYARERGDWLVHTAGDGELRRLAPFLGRIACDGLISMCADVDEAALVAPHVRAHVLVSMRAPRLVLPRVVNDDTATGRLAAEFFLRQGRDRFAFMGGAAHGFAQLRREGFAARLRESGANAPVDLPADISVEQLRALPKGLAVLAANDEDASAFCLACAAADVRVPNEIAVLGVDDDDTYCALTSPALSSIALDLEGIGRAAARRLDTLLDEPGSAVPDTRLVSPLEIRARASTRLGTETDAVVAKALAFMRKNLGAHVGVEDIAKAVGAARRSLETRFQRAHGHGVYHHLMALRVEHARALLGRDGRLLKEIARECGFSDERAMKRAFVAMTGRPPSKWIGAAER